MKISRIAAALVASSFVCGSALAVPMGSSTTFEATSAVSDDLHAGNHNHSIWLPFFESIPGSPLFGQSEGSDFDFIPAGEFVVNADGTANLSGRVVSQVNSNYAFDVDFDFGPSAGPTGDPKKELKPEAYAPVGPIDPSTWHFFDLLGGTLTGVDSFNGLDFMVSQFPENGEFPAQVGDGANNKNGNHGLSVWFLLSLPGINDQNFCDTDYCTLLRDFGQLRGDVNIDLNEIPLPAGMILFGSGLAGLAAARRRRKLQA